VNTKRLGGAYGSLVVVYLAKHCVLLRDIFSLRGRTGLVVFLIAASILTLAQTPLSPKQDLPVVKDPVASSYLQAAVEAMGGEPTVALVKDVVITGTMHPLLDNKDKQIPFVWKLSGPEFRTETQRESGLQIFASGHGHPAVSTNGQVEALFQHMALAAQSVQLPVVLLVAQLRSPMVSLANPGQGTLYGKAVNGIQTSSTSSKDVAAITLQTWYFDSASALPVRVEHRLPTPTDMTDWREAATEYSDFRSVDDIMVPFSLIYYQDNVAIQSFSIAKVEFNVGVDPLEFDLLEVGR
jgi:hypothetical protein